MTIGLLTFKDYGASWDEPSSYQYGREALSAYHLFFSGQEPVYTDNDGVLKYYGAAYLITGAALQSLFKVSDTQSLHFLNFFTFLLAVIALYFLLSRWFSQGAVFATLVLFVSQPLLWGHAFINPKDIPFMAFFLVSLCLGFWMLDRIPKDLSWKNSLPAILAGLALGYATSTRIIAPLAGLIVTIVCLWQFRKKALTFLGVYWISAMFGLFITWPFLWFDPINRFTASLRTMSAFPWKNKILFDGLSYHADNLPWRYLPKLLALQLTEPALILAAVGIAVLAWRTWQRKMPVYLPVLFLLWFGAPLAWVILTRPTIYDNFRQFLFFIPAIFLLCAAALDEIFKRIRGPVPGALIILAALLPGFMAGISLHPYEYVYYNHLAGNISGKYETDYWATSFQEGANYLNENAPKNAMISIGPWGLIQPMLRSDFQIDRSDVSAKSDYVIIFKRWDYEKNPAFTGKPVYTIARDNAVFLVIQKMR